MKSHQKFIGVDLGGESGRVMVGAFDGHKIGLHEKHRFVTGGVEIDGSLRWDTNRLWAEIQKGLSVVGSEGSEVTSVGVDTWGVDYVLLDKQDQPLQLPYHYRDKRSIGTLAQINKIQSKAEIFARTGIQFMEINTLCQLYAAAQVGELDAADCLLTMGDFFHWRLCGFKGNEFTNATTTQCFDPVNKMWATEMLESLSIPARIFGDVVMPGANLGELRDEVAAETGLGLTSVVTPATHDTGSAVAAVPVDEKQYGANWAYISSGTWSLVGVEVAQPVLSQQALEMNVTNEGGVDGTWRLLKNVMGLWIIQQLRAAFSQRSFTRTYEELTHLAENLTNEIYIDPDSPLFLNPANMETALRGFLEGSGQRQPVDEGELVRCVLESLALRYREVLDGLKQLTGLQVEVLHIVGGGSRNGLLNQLIANATGIQVVAGPAESTVMGNVLLQCKSAGSLDSLSEIREVVRNSSELAIFEPVKNIVWQDKLSKFNSICATPEIGSA